jgi:amidohydrolase
MMTRTDIDGAVDQCLTAIENKLIGWRRDFHQNPELGNRETRTSEIIAAHLKRLGLKVQTGVAHTGVVGLLEGGRPGPVLGLRADIDALPIAEQLDLPFKSHVRTTYNGEDVGVMHACGHDGHTAILMAVAETLASVRQELPGSVKFIFQPAEEGVPTGEEGGAQMMIAAGVLKDPKPDAMLALHIVSRFAAGTLVYFKGPMLASSDIFAITVTGRQTHAAMPWLGSDPIVSAAQIVLGLQTIESRQVDVSRQPSVLSVGIVKGGVRHNIIPDMVEMAGTLRTFDEGMRAEIRARIKRTAELIAASSGATADVVVTPQYPVTFSEPNLTERIVPALQRIAGPANVLLGGRMMAADDYAFYGHQVPAAYFVVGGSPKDRDVGTAEPNHSPRFFIDESCLLLGARAMTAAALDLLHGVGRT